MFMLRNNLCVLWFSCLEPVKLSSSSWCPWFLWAVRGTQWDGQCPCVEPWVESWTSVTPHWIRGPVQVWPRCWTSLKCWQSWTWVTVSSLTSCCSRSSHICTKSKSWSECQTSTCKSSCLSSANVFDALSALVEVEFNELRGHTSKEILMSRPQTCFQEQMMMCLHFSSDRLDLFKLRSLMELMSCAVQVTHLLMMRGVGLTEEEEELNLK